MTDLEHLDELERQADSLLDEEAFRNDTGKVLITLLEGVAFVQNDPHPSYFYGSLQVMEAQANIILSECEILRRGDSIR